MKVQLQKILPFTEARNNFSRLVKEVRKNSYFIISKQNKPIAALVDIKYLSVLQEKAEEEQAQKALEILRKAGTKYLQKISGKKKLTEKEAYKLLTGEELTW